MRARPHPLEFGRGRRSTPEAWTGRGIAGFLAFFGAIFALASAPELVAAAAVGAAGSELHRRNGRFADRFTRTMEVEMEHRSPIDGSRRA